MTLTKSKFAIDNFSEFSCNIVRLVENPLLGDKKHFFSL